MAGRRDWKAPTIMVGVALLFAGALYAYVLGALAPAGVGTSSGALPTASASPTPAPRPPEVTIVHETCCAQAARFLDVSWGSSERVTAVTLKLEPAPPFDCSATLDGSGTKGRFGCAGFLRGALDHVATLTVTTAGGSFPIPHRFRTMGDRLENVKWFSEFEDPSGEPLACAAASCRIIGLYTSGQDKMTAQQILDLGRQFSRSRDPGLDPVAIATLLKRLDGGNDYHYYRFATREEATAAAVYWLFRSGRPVVAITLAGQHAPLVIGFQGAYGTYYDDPANKVTGMIVQDPQRGDMRPETASRRPDKYRTPSFQTGHLLGMDEWLRDEWWFGFPYTCCLSGVNIDRNDGAYPAPHWAGKFVLIVDDADAENPSDREGRVRFR